MSSSPSMQVLVPIRPSRVRYIKLGEGGRFEAECLEKGIIRFGFGTAEVERFRLCRAHQWDELTTSFLADGRSKGTATQFTNETRTFFEDDGSTLWITFVGAALGTFNNAAPTILAEGAKALFDRLAK
jgi:hypothetical protein